MVNMTFNVGDIVRIGNESAIKETLGAVGIIMHISTHSYDTFPIKVKFLSSKHKCFNTFTGISWKDWSGNCHHLATFRKEELIKLSEREAVAWLI